MTLLEEVQERLGEARDRLVAALEASAAGESVDLGNMAEVVETLCRDIVRLPPPQGRPLADSLAILIRGLDELESRLRQAKARSTGKADAVPGRAARAYGRAPGR